MARLLFLAVIHPMIVVILFHAYSSAPTEAEGQWAWDLLTVIYYPTSLLFSESKSNMWVLMLGAGHWIALGCAYAILKKTAGLLFGRKPPVKTARPSGSARCSDCGAIFFPDTGDSGGTVDLCPRCLKRKAGGYGQKQGQDEPEPEITQPRGHAGGEPVSESEEISLPEQVQKSFKERLCGSRKAWLTAGIVFAVPAIICLGALIHIWWTAGWNPDVFYYEKEPVKFRWVPGTAYVEAVHTPYNTTDKAYETWVLIQSAAGGKMIHMRYRPKDVKRLYNTRWQALEALKHYKPGKKFRIYYNAYDPERFRLWTPEPPVTPPTEETAYSPLFIFAAFFIPAVVFFCLAGLGYRLNRRFEKGPIEEGIPAAAWSIIRKGSVLYVILLAAFVVAVVWVYVSDPLDKPFALHKAAEQGVQEDVRTLIQRGVPVNKKNRSGFTPLHLAAMAGQVSVVDFLARNGARINKRDNFNRTPLDLATGRTTRRIIRSHGGMTARELDQRQKTKKE